MSTTKAGPASYDDAAVADQLPADVPAARPGHQVRTEPPEPPSNFSVGEYGQQTWSIDAGAPDGPDPDDEDADPDLQAQLDRWMARQSGAEIDDDDDGALLDHLNDDVDAYLADAARAPGDFRRATGEPLWVGFDAEWQYDEATDSNSIVSIQLFVPPQPAITTADGKRELVARLSRVIYASSPTREGRPPLKKSLHRLVTDALDQHLIAAEPSLIYVTGFGLRFDLPVVDDFPELKSEVDSVSGKIATVGANAPMVYSRSLITGETLAPVVVGLHFIDVAAHVAVGTTLRQIGKLIERPKLDIPPPYSIERMREYLLGDRAGFEAYAMRDAEIAVRFAMRLARFAAAELGIKSLPATASGLALKWFLRTLDEAGVDRLQAFGLSATSTETFHAASSSARTVREVGPTPMRQATDSFVTQCYAGGRNESLFGIGPSPVGVWYDYDLAGAYSTGLVDLPLLDFEHPHPSLKVEDYLGHVAGFVLVEFEHPPETRYPVFAVSRGSKGLVFPLKGRAYATAPELRVAHDLGCRVVIHWGVIYPWLQHPGDAVVDGVPVLRPFGLFVKAARQLRNKLKAAAKGSDSLEEQAAKLYMNSIYGKVCQSLRPKNVFDTRTVKQVRLQPSPITNPAIGAHTTGFIRAILAEILNRIPRHRMVLSVTTDGFLSDVTEAEMAACQDGPLCRRFQTLCDEIAPGSKMLEVKHRVAQVICMKTRGQLTGQAIDGEKIVLAKAGVQVVIDAPNDLDNEAYKRLQNDAMLRLYLDREPGAKVTRYQFPSIRDSWEKGVDLHKYATDVQMSLEPDMKRAPYGPRMVALAGGPGMHVALNSRPWSTIEEFDSARACQDGWRRDHCLKTVADWHSLRQAISFSIARGKLRAAGQRTMNLGRGKPLHDALRRGFLRAYAQKALGLPQTFSYPELARWLTGLGYPTKGSEPRSAQAQELVLNFAPRTPAVMRLWRLLQTQFPEADLSALLAEPDSLSSDDDEADEDSTDLGLF